MSGFALTKKEVRCLQCRERTQQEFSVGVCAFCYDELAKKTIKKHNNKVMRYREIDFFNCFEEQLPENAILMVWLSYFTQEGTIKTWHGALPTEKNIYQRLMYAPIEIFERQIKIASRDYKEVCEVICCKVGYP